MYFLNWAQYIQHESPVPEVKSCEGNASVPTAPLRANQSDKICYCLYLVYIRKAAEIKMFRCFPKRFLTADEVLKRNFQLLHPPLILYSLSKKWPKQRRSRLLRSLLVSLPFHSIAAVLMFFPSLPSRFPDGRCLRCEYLSYASSYKLLTILSPGRRQNQCCANRAYQASGAESGRNGKQLLARFVHL